VVTGFGIVARYLCAGPIVAEVERLARAPGAIILDGTTAELLGGSFRVRQHAGRRRLLRHQAPAPARPVLPLLARRREPAFVRGLEAEETGAAVVISGPSGIGKTRLLDEIAGRLDRRVLRARGEPGPGRCWSIVAQLLRAAAGISRAMDPVEARSLLDAYFVELGDAELASDLAGLAGLDAGAERHEDATVTLTGGQGLPPGLEPVVRRWLALELRAPLAILVDDVERAD